MQSKSDSTEYEYGFALCKMPMSSKFLWSINPEKQQKREAKYFILCTKVSSRNNNI